jgi:hypothetical protein
MEKKRRKRWLDHPYWLVDVLVFIGAGLFAYQAILYAHTQYSLLDEGSYLVKGFLFVSGQYRPYELYGVWTNHMPFSFLIPGWVQAIFGWGLRTGRYFSVFMGVIMLLGLWLTARRVGGKWAAVLAVWAFAANPALIKMYSLAITQALAACILTWSLFFVLGDARKRWHLIVGTVLATLLMLTRVNMAPVLLAVLLYILWQYGWKDAFWAGVVSAVLFLTVQAIYWPEVLRFWVPWLPDRLQDIPLAQPWMLGGQPSTTPMAAVSLKSRLFSLTQAIRFSFFIFLAVAAAWLVTGKRIQQEARSNFRSFVVLSVLFVILLLMHIQVTITGQHCVYCLQIYMTFFDGIGVVLLALSLPYWRNSTSKWYNALITIILLGVSSLAGYSAYKVVSDALITGKFLRELLTTRISRYWLLQFTPENIEVIVLFQNKFNLTRNEVYTLVGDILRLWMPVGLGFLVGGVLLLFAFGLYKRSKRRDGWMAANFAAWALTVFLLVGLVFTPTPILSGDYDAYDCSGDEIAAMEAVGVTLTQHIPPGARVFWKGGNSFVPMLYVPEVKIYPAQINGRYSFVDRGTLDKVEQFGLWNAELEARWQEEADFYLIADEYYTPGQLEAKGWMEVALTQPVDVCREDSAIHILQKTK